MDDIFEFIKIIGEILFTGITYVILGGLVLFIRVIQDIGKYRRKAAEKMSKNPYKEPPLKKGYVSKKRYILLAFFLGWMGVHKFYEEKIILGLLYFVFFFTGIPFIISVFEGISTLRKKADLNGKLQL